MQKLAYDIVNCHFQNNSAEKDSLCLILIGVAGKGNSFLVNALRGLLQDKCVATATTGKASYNIRGETIHSSKATVASRGRNDRKDQNLHKLQKNINGVDYIFIDKNSLLGQQTFG